MTGADLQPLAHRSMPDQIILEKPLIFISIVGGVFVLAGLFGLGYCIREGIRIRGAQLAPEEINARLQKLVGINLGSVALAALGLGLVVVGLML